MKKINVFMCFLSIALCTIHTSWTESSRSSVRISAEETIAETPAVQMKNKFKLLGRNDNNIRFYYKEADHGLIIDGTGSFTVDDYTQYCAPDMDCISYVVVGKNVEIPENITEHDANINMFIITVKDICRAELYTYPDTDCINKINAMVEYMKEQREEFDGHVLYPVNIIDETQNVCDIYETYNETLFTRGDINCDEKVDVTDLSELSLMLIGDMTSDSIMEKAADTDDDGKVTTADLARLRQYISRSLKSWNETKIYHP